jgi:hypothetical protein
MVFSPFIRSGEICFSTYCWHLSLSSIVALGAVARLVLWSEVVDPEVVDLSLFSDFVVGCSSSWPEAVRGAPGQNTTVTCASLLAAGLFINSQSFVTDGAYLDLSIVEAQRLFQRVSR